MNGISALIKGTPERSLHPSPCEDRVRRWPSVNQKAGSHENLTMLHSDLELPPFSAVINKFLLFISHPIYSTFL